MKRLYTFIMLLSFGSITFTGCSSSRNSTKGIFDSGTSMGGTVIKTVGTVVGIIIISKIVKSILKTVGGSRSFAALSQSKSFAADFNEDTKINSFAQNDLMKTALQVLVAERYEIPLTKVANNFSTLNTVGDLSTFIGQNASVKVLNEIK